MTSKRIVIVSPRTWGQFGNYLAATRLAGVLRDRLPGAEVIVWAAESSMPWVGEIGARIADITLTSPDPATRTARYLRLMAQIEDEHPQGFETDPASTVLPKVDDLSAALRAASCDLVIGTKGFIARLCKAAVSNAGLAIPVVSYVTNPGLLELPIHRSALLDAVVVPFDWAKDSLVRMEGVAPTTVHVVGPLVAGRDMRPFVGHTTTDSGQMSGWPAADDVCSRAKVIIFSNRGGDDYLRVLEHLSVRSDDVDVVFVGYDDPELVGRAMGGRPPARWRFHTRLTQAEYFRYLDEAGAAQGAFLISKSGPNTTLESAYFGIPVLMLESGLPMEAWVGGLIHDRGLGQCCDGADELISVLDTWLADPAYVQRHKNACQNFAVGTLNQTVTARRIGDLMRILLGQGTGGAQAAWTPETTMSKRA